jgi:hypothetical protein
MMAGGGRVRGESPYFWLDSIWELPTKILFGNYPQNGAPVKQASRYPVLLPGLFPVSSQP